MLCCKLQPKIITALQRHCCSELQCCQLVGVTLYCSLGKIHSLWCGLLWKLFDHLLNFWAPIISLEWVKLGTANFTLWYVYSTWNRQHIQLVQDTVISTVLLKMSDFWRSQAVKHAVPVVIFWHRCKREMLSVQTTNRKWYVAAIPTTFKVTHHIQAFSVGIFHTAMQQFTIQCNPDNCIGAIQPSFMLLSGICN